MAAEVIICDSTPLMSMHCYCLRLSHPDTSQEDANDLDDERTVKKSNAASDKDSLSGDTNVNADENKDVSESYLQSHPKQLRKINNHGIWYLYLWIFVKMLNAEVS